MPPLPPWPFFDEDERSAVDRVLASGRVNAWTGQECEAFQSEWADFHMHADAPRLHTLTMANGSLTLDAAMHALGIGPGDDVLCAPRTYVASAMCAVLAGARPVFADVDPNSGCVTAETLEAARTPATRAVIPVHVGGWPCDMPSIMEWADSHDVLVIEDCAQSHGATIAGRPVGTFGHAASWSFCQDKIMTTGGEGGMFATADPDVWKRAWAFSQHGKDWDIVQRTDHPPGFRWQVRHTGTNLRLTEMQAAIGRIQLGKLPAWLAARRRNFDAFARALADVDVLRTPDRPKGHACYRFVIYLADTTEQRESHRDALISAITEAGWPAMMGSCSEVYREACFTERGLGPRGRLQNARLLGETALTLLVHPTISAEVADAYARAVAACASTPLPTPDP